ncbi:Asp23/Gls24 family envelope stress response protein [Dethiothermospora halolimnae]|uniref:Asp23/Gls24 family envelope stress response protein n=1 Tax=Dethiothermospora halolimnae TaxID=3114390 RepID=UPI003CCC456D
MPGKIDNKYGYINIDDTVIATIAGSAAMECYGLVGMASRNATEGLVELLRRENLTKGVRVHTEGEDVVVDLYIVVEFGTKISVVANNIIERVKYTVEDLTGMRVQKVNINVQGVRVQK